MRFLSFYFLTMGPQNPFDINPNEIVVSNQIANLWVAILISFLAFTLLFTLLRPLMVRCLLAFASVNDFKQLFKDIHAKGTFVFIFPFIVAVFSFAIFSNFLFSKWLVYQIFLVLCLTILVKFVAIRTVGLLYGFKIASHYYSYSIVIFYIVLGTLLAPINLFLLFPNSDLEQVLLFIGILFSITMFILRYIRVAQVNFALVSPNKFHFLLYICTLELGPFLVIYKLIFSQLTL
ncbi:MAG: hypothetical protein RLZZ248_1550 [Bacteroidota bacterium]